MFWRGISVLFPIAASIPAIVTAQDSTASLANMSAREIFYSQAPAPSPAVKSSAMKSAVTKSSPAKTSAAKASAPKSSGAGQHPVEVADGKPSPADREANDSAMPVRTAPPASVRASVVNAADRPARALGLKYTIVKVAGRAEEPVGIRSVFHSGDRIKINVEVNDAAYLYVISRGASGTWSPLFPSKDVSDGSNRVEPGKTYDIPSGPGRVIAFREPSGSERLFIVVSREPEPSLERLIYSVNSGSAAATAQPSDDTGVKMMMASAQPIGEDTVGGLRAWSRDLIVEDAGEATQNGSGSAPDKSFYAVNPTGSADSRVVADITLKHQ